MNFDFGSLLGFDRAASVVTSAEKAGRKLCYWTGRISETDYPSTLTADLPGGEFCVLTGTKTDSVVAYASQSTNFKLEIDFTTDQAVTAEITVAGIKYSYSSNAFSEGLLTLMAPAPVLPDTVIKDPVLVRIAHEYVRPGNTDIRVNFNDIPRAALGQELDLYVRTRMGVITDQAIKGITYDGRWRLAQILKFDSENADDPKVSLIYKKGYATTLNFSEAFLISKTESENATELAIKFQNLDPRTVEAAKVEASSQATNPEFGGVVYSGSWVVTSVKTSESETTLTSSADLSDAGFVIWYLTKTGSTTSAAILVGLERSSLYTEETYLYQNIHSADLASFITTNTSLAKASIDSRNTAVVSTDARKSDIAGYFNVHLVIRSYLTPAYIVSGRKKTGMFDEETRLYKNVEFSDVTNLINSITVLGAYTLVSSGIGRIGDDGLCDVSISLRSLIVPSGGNLIVIGCTGGMFRSKLYILRNIKDSDVTAKVSGLSLSSLIESVRATRSESDGYWDIIYSELIVPPPRTEYKKTDDRREYQSGSAELKTPHTVYNAYITSLEEDPVTHKFSGIQEYLPKKIYLHQGYAGGGGVSRKRRTVSIASIFTYSADQPSSPDFGEVSLLSNGIWQKIDEVTEYPAWWDAAFYFGL